MQDRLQQIVAVIESIDNVIITVPFIEDQGSIKGTVKINVGDRSESFETIIGQQYPFQFHNVETIKFLNRDLIINNHVNGDGSICVHTLHSPNLGQKLLLDFASLKEWMRRYLINNQTDVHYEHVVVPVQKALGVNQIMLFTDLDCKLRKGDFGEISFSHLDEGTLRDEPIATNILQSITIGKQEFKCSWSAGYKALDQYQGIYVILDKPPVINGRFMVDDWDDLNGVLPQNFVDFLESTESALQKKNYGKITILLGYTIQNDLLHWQLISIEKSGFPVFIEKVYGARRLHVARLKKQPILWGETRNCSYAYFFGRGAFCERLTKSKILIIGLGAVGSMVAQTLCRSGCLRVDLIDYDAKEPENVCRSEYQFLTGVNDKVNELRRQLQDISPFIETSGNSMITDGAKIFWSDPNAKQVFQEYFNGYEIIFDCSADNDLAYLINQFELQSEVINLSITNHAKELVCAVNPNLYPVLMHIFSILQKENDQDLYNPTGCWSPTFKAGYNDIAVLVQHALKQINRRYTQQQAQRSFYLSASIEGDFDIKATTL